MVSKQIKVDNDVLERIQQKFMKGSWSTKLQYMLELIESNQKVTMNDASQQQGNQKVTIPSNHQVTMCKFDSNLIKEAVLEALYEYRGR